MAIETVDAMGRPMERHFAEPSELFASVPLTNVSIDFRNEAEDYAADRVLPPIPVEKPKGTYYIFGKEALEIPEGIERAPKTSYAVIDWEPTEGSYDSRDYGVQYPMSDEEKDLADAAADPEIVSTQRLTGIVLNKREKLVADLLTTLANHATTNRTTLSGTSQWSDATSDPIEAVETGINAIHAAGAPSPNVLAMGYQVWQKLRRHPSLLRAANLETYVPDAKIAEALGVARIVVSKARYNTVNAGQTFTGGYIWGKHAVLLYVTPSPSKYTPTAGYQFRHVDLISDRYDSRSNKVTWLRTRMHQDQKIVSQACAYLIRDAVA
jgi:hypothetical protein